MDFHGSHYYRVNRILLSSIGLWPEQDTTLRTLQIILCTSILISGVVFQCTAFLTRDYDLDTFVKVFSSSVPIISYALKYNVIASDMKNVRQVITRVEHNWSLLKSEEEVQIMRHYANFSKIITLSCASGIYMSIFVFLLVEFSPDFLDLVAPLNESRSHQLPILVEYFVDHEKYMCPILLHLVVVNFVGLTVLIATESAIMSYIQHLCGMFEVVCYRIQTTLHENQLSVAILEDVVTHKGLVEAIDIHNGTIEFTDFIKITFRKSYIFLLPLGVASLSINLYQLSQLSVAQFNEFFIVSLLTIGQIGYIFFCNFMVQQLVDHADMVSYKAYDSHWYAAPVQMQKILLFILQRSMKKLTFIIVLFTPSLEGFLTLVSMSMSYYMMIRSTR